MNNFYISHEEIPGVEMNLDHDQILMVKNILGVSGDELADMLTGLNSDSYADKICDILAEGETIEEAIDYDPEGYEVCRSYHRIMNFNLTDEQCEKEWIEACQNDLELFGED